MECRFESRLDDSARFWTAAALRRFSAGRRARKAPEGWRSPRRFARLVNHRQTLCVLDGDIFRPLPPSSKLKLDRIPPRR
jgi:hypothetical protein